MQFRYGNFLQTFRSIRNATNPRSIHSSNVKKCTRITHRYTTTCSSTTTTTSKHKDDKKDTALTQLRRATDKLAFAIEGTDWVEASANTAFLERHATERPPRAHFSIIAGRNACTLVEQALLEVHHLLAATTPIAIPNDTPQHQDGHSALCEEVTTAKQLVDKGYQCVKQLRTDVATAEQRLLQLKR